MIANRRRFQPGLDNSLENRTVQSRVLPLPAAVAIHYGTQTHPQIALTKNERQTPTYQYGNTPRHFTFRAKLDRRALPEYTAAEKANPYLNTYKVSYKNGTPKSFSWAAITIRLDHGLRYVPGAIVQPPGSKLTVTMDANGLQTLSLILPSGIPTGSSGYVAFVTKYTNPPYQPTND